MALKQLTNSLFAPDGSYYVTITDGIGSTSMNKDSLSVADGVGTDASGTFTNATQATSITATSCDGYSTITVSMNGTYGTASGIFEQSDDGGANFYPILLTQEATGISETGYTSLTNTSRMWRGSISGADTFRVRSTAVASGTVNILVSPSAFPFTPVTTSSPYPNSAVPVTISTTGTTAATAATLPGVANKTTYISGFSITSDATAALAGTATVAGVVSGTMSFIQGVGVAPAVVELSKFFDPPIPASAVNTGIVITSVAAGVGGNTAVNAWGYQL